MSVHTDYGHPERAFFQTFEIFGLGRTNRAENLWGIWAISGQTISTILALWVPYQWESVAGSLFYKKVWFLGLKRTTPKCSQNNIFAAKNLENRVHTSVFGALEYPIFSHFTSIYPNVQVNRGVINTHCSHIIANKYWTKLCELSQLIGYPIL